MTQRPSQESGFTLIETLISVALLAMIIAFTLQMQQRFAQHVSRQEIHQCVAERVGRAQKQLYGKRPLAEIEIEQNCGRGRGSTEVAVTVVSGAYPPAIPVPENENDTPELSACAELSIEVSWNGEAQFNGDAYICDFGD